jgi:hypothetical protein
MFQLVGLFRAGLRVRRPVRASQLAGADRRWRQAATFRFTDRPPAAETPGCGHGAATSAGSAPGALKFFSYAPPRCGVRGSAGSSSGSFITSRPSARGAETRSSTPRSGRRSSARAWRASRGKCGSASFFDDPADIDCGNGAIDLALDAPGVATARRPAAPFTVNRCRYRCRFVCWKGLSIGRSGRI